VPAIARYCQHGSGHSAGHCHFAEAQRSSADRGRPILLLGMLRHCCQRVSAIWQSAASTLRHLRSGGLLGDWWCPGVDVEFGVDGVAGREPLANCWHLSLERAIRFRVRVVTRPTDSTPTAPRAPDMANLPIPAWQHGARRPGAAALRHRYRCPAGRRRRAEADPQNRGGSTGKVTSGGSATPRHANHR